MTEIEIKLGKPYSRQGEDYAGVIKLEFSAVFTSQDKALAFQQSLIQLVRESQE